VTGEITAGKRTFLQRENRHAFELPKGHEAKLMDLGGEFGQCVALTIPGGGGGTYRIRELEELDDHVIVHVGDPIGQHGQPSVGAGPMMPITGYVFLDD
jgi:hypothetical protein